MSKLSLFLLGLLLPFLSIAQNNADGCGVRENHSSSSKKHPWVGNGAFLEKYLTSIDYKEKDKVYYQIPVQFWVYTDRSGATPYTFKMMSKLIANLNDFNQKNNTGFRYYLLPKINFVKKKKHMQIRWDGEALWVARKYRNKKAINVHLVDEIVRKKLFLFGKKSSSYQGLYNGRTSGVFVRDHASTTTLTHEIGHYFGLLHTHKYSKKGKSKQEAVKRDRMKKYKGKKVRNCEVNGDQLCDTPADPKIGWYVDENCNFNGTHLNDKWGDAYRPDPTNIMAYPRFRKCRVSFSRGQKAVMLYTAEKKKLSKNWKVNSNSVLADAAEPDNREEMAQRVKIGTTYSGSLHQVRLGKSSEIDRDYFMLKLKKSRKVAFEISGDVEVFYKSKRVKSGEVVSFGGGENFFFVGGDKVCGEYRLKVITR